MSFTGNEFLFDGISSKMYGLTLCNFDGAKQDEGVVGSEVSIIEDRIARRMTGLHYGITNNDAKEFSLVFVVEDPNRRLDRYDTAAIAKWLTGHNDYKELIIDQFDMDGVFYRCIITELEQIELGMRVVGFTATVVCDSPYAYRRVAPTVIPSGSQTFVYKNMSNVNDYYHPVIDIVCSGTELSIKNVTDGGEFKLTGMPSGDKQIEIDSQSQVITCSDGTNLYQYWNTDVNKYFPRFVGGDNQLVIAGDCMITIQNEFPWNIGH